MIDYKALCAELLQGLDENRHPEVRYPGHLRLVMDRARAALAEPDPVPVGTTRRVYFDMPSTIAECGGPCSEGGPEACDCGALWRDEPVAEPEPVRPTDKELLGWMLKAAASVPGGQCTGILDWDQEAIAAGRAVLARWGRLAVPEPVNPTDEELMETYWQGTGLIRARTGSYILRGVRAVLTRWGNR